MASWKAAVENWENGFSSSVWAIVVLDPLTLPNQLTTEQADEGIGAWQASDLENNWRGFNSRKSQPERCRLYLLGLSFKGFETNNGGPLRNRRLNEASLGFWDLQPTSIQSG
jgi:hypothetical protein